MPRGKPLAWLASVLTEKGNKSSQELDGGNKEFSIDNREFIDLTGIVASNNSSQISDVYWAGV